jgi:colanic acid/amylovoran biosynthesis glycosyltransferase
MNKNLKIAIYSGAIPSTTFIERLIVGISKSGYEIQLYGSLKEKVTYNSSLINVYSFSDTKWNKFVFLSKYTILLFLFRRADKKLLDAHISKTSKNYRMAQIKYYPVLWHKPDVFHLQWAKSTTEWLWIQDFGMKLVVSLRGTHNTVSPIADLDLKKSYEKNFPKVDGFHAVSKALGRESEKYGANPDKIKVVYSGLSKIEISIKNNIYGVEMNPLKILSIGRSHWIKGYNYALDACAILKNQNIDFHYTIIGAKGVEELEYQKSDLGLNDCVTFLDGVPYDEVLRKMQESHILLLPSVEEGIANVILEAMMLEKLVLTTNCGGMEEVVQEGVNGFVVPIRNAEAISAKIIEINKLTRNQIDQISTNARKTIELQNSEEKMVTDMEALYHFVLEKSIS